MDPISGISAIFGIAVVCFQVGTVLLETYNTWKDADAELHERVILVEGIWVRTKRQIEFAQRIAPQIDDELFHSLDSLLEQLHRRLSTASSRIESIRQKETSRRGGFLHRSSSRAKLAWTMKKDAIDKTVKDLEEWQTRFDPTWFFMIAIGDSVVDQELHTIARTGSVRERRGAPNAAQDPIAVAAGIRAALGSEGHHKSIFLPESPMELMDIRYCEAQMCRLISTSGDNKWYIVNTIQSRPGIPSKVLAEDANNLGSKLATSDPLAFGLLNCKGVMPITVKQSRTSREQLESVRMIFRFPDGVESLQSLRDVLLVFPQGISQTKRVRIACALAKSISYMHTFKFVHKNVRPESILYFQQDEQDDTFLVGFDAFRAADGNTNLLGDLEWDRNLYRHPQRQGVYLAEQYRMEHDMYSLGVCLLEIGLWESLVDYTAGEPVPGKWFGNFETWLNGHMPQAHELPWKVKGFLTSLAESSLPARMGDKYAAAVTACLTCLDSDQSPERMAGEVKVAVHFIEEILFLLQDISI